MNNNKKYYWLKLKNDFFTDKRIKKLRKVAGGDTYTIIYLKMQLLSLQDEGNLFYEGIEDTFEEEIALQIDEDIEDVRITINFLINTGLLIQDNNIYELIETKNCIGSETRNAESMRKLREKRKKKLTLLQNVTNCYIEKEIEKDIEIEKDNIYKYIEENFARTLSPIEYEEISKWENNDLTRYAIKQAVLNGAYSIKYITKILYNYEKQGIKTVQQAQEKEKQFKNKKQIEPEWFDKDLKNEEMTEEEKEELDNLLENIEDSIGELNEKK